MFYINQLRTPSFPIGLIKTESGFIVRPVETCKNTWVVLVQCLRMEENKFTSRIGVS